MAEKVVILHEPEACSAYSALKHMVENKRWDLLDEAEFNELVFVKGLLVKLEDYLDKMKGKDVVEL